MKYSLYLLFTCAFFASSCSSNLTKDITRKYPPLDRNEEVRIIELKEESPTKAEQIGTLHIDDSGSEKDCSWQAILEKLKREARKAGGNTIKIATYIPPGTAGSKCHEVTALILKAENPPLAPRNLAYGSTTAALPDTAAENYTTLRLAAGGGYTYRTADTPPGVTGIAENYLNGLKSGFHFNANATYFVDAEYGGGLTFSHSMYSNSLSGVSGQNPNGETVNGNISDKIGILFIGPSFTGRQISKNRLNSFFTTASIGYLSYTDNGVVLDQKATLTGSTLGSALDIGYDFGVNEDFSVGLQVSYIAGVITTMTIDNGTQKQTLNAPKGSGESLNRLDFSIGVRFNK